MAPPKNWSNALLSVYCLSISTTNKQRLKSCESTGSENSATSAGVKTDLALATALKSKSMTRAIKVVTRFFVETREVVILFKRELLSFVLPVTADANRGEDGTADGVEEGM
jgi:hypothetical protein